ncbi:hypothetical protein VTK56DRAFT_6516 [Thermocarpiscus australiensis]
MSLLDASRRIRGVRAVFGRFGGDQELAGASPGPTLLHFFKKCNEVGLHSSLSWRLHTSSGENNPSARLRPTYLWGH